MILLWPYQLIFVNFIFQNLIICYNGIVLSYFFWTVKVLLNGIQRIIEITYNLRIQTTNCTKQLAPRFIESCDMKYVPKCGKYLSGGNVADNRWQLGILEHLSKYECYVYAFTGGIHSGFPRLFHLESCSTTYRDDYRILFHPYCIYSFNMTMVFLNLIAVKTPRNLELS